MELINKEFTIQGDFVKQAYGGDDWSREEWLDLVVKVKQEMDKMKKQNETLKKRLEIREEACRSYDHELHIEHTRFMKARDKASNVQKELDELKQEHKELVEESDKIEEIVRNTKPLDILDECLRVWYEDEEDEEEEEEEDEEEEEQETHFFTYDENGVEFFKTIEELLKSPARKEDMYVYVGELNEEEYDDDEDDYREMTALDYIQK